MGDDDGGIQEHNNNKTNNIKILEVQNVMYFNFLCVFKVFNCGTVFVAEVFNIGFAVCPSFCMNRNFPQEQQRSEEVGSELNLSLQNRL